MDFMNQPVSQKTGVYIVFGFIFVMVMTLGIWAEWGKRHHKGHPRPSH